MNEVFSSVYAEAYDWLYREKDYAAECDLIERIFKQYGDGSIRTIVDLGCGTGNHALPLAERGYVVAGVDRSADMLAHARRKAAALGTDRVTFHQGDVRDVDLGRTFDAALMMFAVLGYQLTNADVLAALRTARRHLRPGGLFIFDVWYGPAVLHERPSQRMKVIETATGKILRIASSDLDTRRHLCTVHYHLWHFDGERIVAEVQERHCMRYMFPLELELFLESAGFTPVRLGAFPDFDRDPDETTWNILGIAQAV